MSAAILRLFAGLFGAAGVAGAAYAAHGGIDVNLSATAAAILLVHAPALLSLSIATERPALTALLPGLLLIVGVLLFSGDLYARLFLGGRLFPNAAPIGGFLLMGGWLAVCIGAFTGARR